MELGDFIRQRAAISIGPNRPVNTVVKCGFLPEIGMLGSDFKAGMIQQASLPVYLTIAIILSTAPSSSL
jgi:hypothetical protein